MIERRERRRRDGTVYAVWRARWRDETGAERSKTFDRAADARAWEAKVRMMKRGGALAELDAGAETLAEFVEEWWLVYAGPNLERSTLRTYAQLWNGHAHSRLGHLQLRQLTPQTIARFRAELEGAGVGRVQVVDEHVDVCLLRPIALGPGRRRVIGNLLERQAAPPVVRVGDRGPVRVRVVALEAEQRLPEPRGSVGIGALEDDAEQASDGFGHGASLPSGGRGHGSWPCRLDAEFVMASTVDDAAELVATELTASCRRRWPHCGHAVSVRPGHE